MHIPNGTCQPHTQQFKGEHDRKSDSLIQSYTVYSDIDTHFRLLLILVRSGTAREFDDFTLKSSCWNKKQKQKHSSEAGQNVHAG